MLHVATKSNPVSFFPADPELGLYFRLHTVERGLTVLEAWAKRAAAAAAEWERCWRTVAPPIPAS